MPIVQPLLMVKYTAMMSALNITGKKERVLGKYTRQHLGPAFCPTQKIVSILAVGHTKVHTGSMPWIYESKEREETAEWTEKDLHTEIEVQLLRYLKSRGMRPSDVKAVQAVVGGDHGDTAFQFGAAITAEMHDGRKIYFEVTTVKLICRKDTSKLLEATILPRLTTGLKIISTQPLHLYSNDVDSLVCSFNTPPPDSPPHALLLQDHTTIEISVFVTGDLAFQAMILGREAKSGQHCMMCQLSRKQFNQNKKSWLTLDLS